MAKADWCTVAPMEGNGDGTINISAGAFNGRIARDTAVIVQAANGSRPSKSITVSQSGVGTITTMEASKPDVPKMGGTVTINGTSNSSRLPRICYVKAGLMPEVNITTLVSEFSMSVRVNDVEVPAEVTGDPGASGVYNFVVTLIFPAFIFPVDGAVRFVLKDDTGAEKSCTMTWKAGASSLSVDKTSLSLVNGGTAQTVAVTSNDDWAVS